MTTLGYLFAPEASGAINYEILSPAYFKPIFRMLNASAFVATKAKFVKPT